MVLPSETVMMALPLDCIVKEVDNVADLGSSEIQKQCFCLNKWYCTLQTCEDLEEIKIHGFTT